ncbi:hypothetical protein [Nocardia sp. CNY236]|uniref:hypothetical protein n=1 Tax=Nocardia sp. CNY236 TaxID=1169152 RepID=UPI0003FB971D|nr:hypothetical protein [Nocardia sp. CNY236]
MGDSDPAAVLSISEGSTIWTATRSGRIGFVDAADIAAVAVRRQERRPRSQHQAAEFDEYTGQ